MFKLSKGYRWNTTLRGKSIILIYFINQIPYTYDNLTKESEENLEIILEATANHVYTEDEVYWASYYLIEEQVHPLLFELELDNPELLPAD